jgi:hypothetical protein
MLEVFTDAVVVNATISNFLQFRPGTYFNSYCEARVGFMCPLTLISSPMQL